MHLYSYTAEMVFVSSFHLWGRWRRRLRRGFPLKSLPRLARCHLSRFAAIPIGIPHPGGEHSGRATIGRRFYEQLKRQRRLGSEVLCMTSAFEKGSLVLSHLHVIPIESLGFPQRRSRTFAAEGGCSPLCPRFHERSDVKATTRLASAAMPTHHLCAPSTSLSHTAAAI